MKKQTISPSTIYFAVALSIIIALNVFIISRIVILQNVIETLSASISKIPELAEPLFIPVPRH